MKALKALVEQWRRDAQVLRQYGADKLADVNDLHATQLLTAMQSADDELLTPDAAVTWTGYSARHLRSLVAAGTLTNHGKPGAPLYRRVELPRKPGHDPEAVAAEARATLQAMRLAS